MPRTKEAPATRAYELPPQFKSFNKQNCALSHGREAKAMLSVTSAGAWRLSKRLAELLRLEDGGGCGVAFHYDGAQEEWYLERDDQNGFTVRIHPNGGFLFGSRALLAEMSRQFKDEQAWGQMLVAEEPVVVANRRLYPVLTASLVQRRRRNKS